MPPGHWYMSCVTSARVAQSLCRTAPALEWETQRGLLPGAPASAARLCRGPDRDGASGRRDHRIVVTLEPDECRRLVVVTPTKEATEPAARTVGCTQCAVEDSATL